MLTFWKTMTPRTGAALLLALAVIALLAGLNFCQLQSGDETRTAGIAAEMFVDGDYLVPRLNGTPFLEYPPLYSWSAALAYSVFGITDFAAKLPSALAAIGGVMLAFGFAGLMKLPVWSRFLSGFFLLTGAQFFSNSRTCRVDMVLAFFVLLAVYGFFAMRESGTPWKKLGAWGLFALGLVGGIYTKGLLGIALPGAALGCWLVVDDGLNRRFSLGAYLAAAAGALAALASAGVWYWLLWRNGGKEMFHTAFFVNNLGRFSGSQGDHTESAFYYFIKLPSLFLPWLPLLPFAIWAAFRRIRDPRNSGVLLVLSFLLVPFAALCVASSKRVVYLLPLYAPCALLCGWYLTVLPERVRAALQRPLERIPLDSGRRVWCAVLLLGVILSGAATAVSLVQARKESLRPLFEACAALQKAGKQVVLASAPERTRGAAFFYLHRKLGEVDRKNAPAVPGEYWIFRDKRSSEGTRYADSHHLVKR